MRKFLALMLPAVLLLTSCSQLIDEVREEVASELDSMEYDYDSDYDWDDDDWLDGVWLSDFEDSCYGAPVEGGTAYDPEAGGIHKVAIFDRDSDYDTYYNMSYILPEAWEATYENPEETQLVVCLTAVPGEFVEACEYDIEGVDYTLNNYAATYQTELYAASTGELVAETVLEAPAEECPMFWYFFELEEDYYSAYDEPLKSWIKDYVQ